MKKIPIREWLNAQSMDGWISGIKELKTPYRTPQANGICKRFVDSLRRESIMDHVLIHDGKDLLRMDKEYAKYFNQERPHQGHWTADP